MKSRVSIVTRLLGKRESLNQTYLRLTKLAASILVPNYRAAFRSGRTGAAVEHQRILESLQLETILDAGANQGQFALVARQAHPNAKIHCFEPLPDAADRLRLAVPSVEIHEVALGAEQGSSELYVTEADDNSSLLAPGTTNSWKGLQVADKIEVKVSTLDEVLRSTEMDRPSLLKIDVQGAELQVLIGADDCIHQLDHIYVEVSFVELYDGQPLAHEIVKFLADKGFRITNISEVKYDGSGFSTQADVLFSR